jgi:hypothetical protein
MTITFLQDGQNATCRVYTGNKMVELLSYKQWESEKHQENGIKRNGRFLHIWKGERTLLHGKYIILIFICKYKVSLLKN